MIGGRLYQRNFQEHSLSVKSTTKNFAITSCWERDGVSMEFKPNKSKKNRNCKPQILENPQKIRWFFLSPEFKWEFDSSTKPQRSNRTSFGAVKNWWMLCKHVLTKERNYFSLKFPSESNSTFKSVNWVDTKSAVIALLIANNSVCVNSYGGISNQPFAHHYKKLAWVFHGFAIERNKTK